MQKNSNIPKLTAMHFPMDSDDAKNNATNHYTSSISIGLNPRIMFTKVY